MAAYLAAFLGLRRDTSCMLFALILDLGCHIVADSPGCFMIGFYHDALSVRVHGKYNAGFATESLFPRRFELLPALGKHELARRALGAQEIRYFLMRFFAFANIIPGQINKGERYSLSYDCAHDGVVRLAAIQPGGRGGEKHDCQSRHQVDMLAQQHDHHTPGIRRAVLPM